MPPRFGAKDLAGEPRNHFPPCGYSYQKATDPTKWAMYYRVSSTYSQLTTINLLETA
jgi:hypothetical protein